MQKPIELATFAGGCFWCMVKPFDELPGIVSIVSGYTGGHTPNPTYEEVGMETTRHREAVQITFEPDIFPYKRLLDIYWQLIDPTDEGGQFMDRGASYRTAIFVHDEQQRKEAEASKAELAASKRFEGNIVTEILPAGPFYPAENEHQAYYKTNRYAYNQYVEASGREQFAKRHWHTHKDKQRLRKQLTDAQYRVTQEAAEEVLEPLMDNEAGVYVDVISGDPLFTAADRFEDSSGRYAFTGPIREGLLRKQAELGGGQPRITVWSRLSGSYLGRFVNNGPAAHPRYYQIHPAAVRFISDQVESRNN